MNDNQHGLFINGAWRESEDGATFTVTNPATDDVLAVLPDAGPGDAAAAISGAASAQDDWAAASVAQRVSLLRGVRMRILSCADELAELITLESGKPLAEGRGEVAYSAQYLEWFADQATQAMHGEHYRDPSGSIRILTTRRPVGPAYLITPWNFPLAMIARKVAPALAAGCTSVIKPSELTPLTAMKFVELLVEEGLPNGVVNLITTTRPREVSDSVFASSALRKVSFTGSTAVGSELLRSASTRVVNTSMELGGNAPLIVLPDADPDDVSEIMVAKLRNGGQSCIAANRLLVHESLGEQFISALVKHFGELRVGDGRDPETDLGPLIDARAADRVGALVDAAVTEGASIEFAGEVPRTSRAFYPPTVLSHVEPDSDIWKQEIFGPVATVTTFTSEDQAVEMANATPYGLAAYVFTPDVSRAMRLAERLEFGIVGVNRGMVSRAAAPFGGMKSSGVGREGGLHGLDDYLETQYVSLS